MQMKNKRLNYDNIKKAAIINNLIYKKKLKWIFISSLVDFVVESLFKIQTFIE